MHASKVQRAVQKHTLDILMQAVLALGVQHNNVDAQHTHTHTHTQTNTQTQTQTDRHTHTHTHTYIHTYTRVHSHTHTWCHFVGSVDLDAMDRSAEQRGSNLHKARNRSKLFHETSHPRFVALPRDVPECRVKSMVGTQCLLSQTLL